MAPPNGPTPMPRPTATAVIGLQWGDEGKGKIVDILAARHDAVVRFNGGANAGHTVIIAGQKYALHLVPVGALTPGAFAIIGNGVVVDPDALIHEMDGLIARGVDCKNVVVSDRAHVVMPYHKDEDALREVLLAGAGEDEPDPAGEPRGARADRSLGTTRRGIGPAYADKHQRSTAIRIGDLLRPERLRETLELACEIKGRTLPRLTSHPPEGVHPHYNPEHLYEKAMRWGERLQPHIRDTAYFLHDLLAREKRLLFEGANATLLDVDHGTFPYVTSSACAVLGIGPGSGVSERRIETVLGVMKAYSTRVGAGPFPTEQKNAIGDRIRERGKEYGTTTGRPRRTGWLDLVAVRYSAMLNGATGLALMLFDVLEGFDEVKICTAYETPAGRTDRFLPDAYALSEAKPVYETLAGFPSLGASGKPPTRRADLHEHARKYLEFVEERVGIPIRFVSIGPDRAQTLEA